MSVTSKSVTSKCLSYEIQTLKSPCGENQAFNFVYVSVVF